MDDQTAMACPICSATSVADATLGTLGLARCQGCGFLFLEQPDSGTADLYDDAYFAAYAGGDYRSEEAQRRYESRLRLDWVARWAPPPARLLEIGAAAGYFLDEARDRGYETRGVEVSDAMASAARDQLDLRVTTARIEDAALPVEQDLICAWHVVEHLPDPLSAVRRLGEALAPGGHLALEVPNVASARARQMGPDWPALDLPHHVGHHGPRSLRVLLESSGLTVVALDTIPFAAYDRGGRRMRAIRAAVDSWRARKALRPSPHPSNHELLRAVAIRDR